MSQMDNVITELGKLDKSVLDKLHDDLDAFICETWDVRTPATAYVTMMLFGDLALYLEVMERITGDHSASDDCRLLSAMAYTLSGLKSTLTKPVTSRIMH